MKTVMGRDQQGTTYHDLGRYPRKALLARLGYKKADKMYRDVKAGATNIAGARHVGYVIGNLWITLYTVTDWKDKQ